LFQNGGVSWSESMARIEACWYQATCFGEPCGPWRGSLREARADLEEHGLGSYDNYGTFFTTVPGGLDCERVWMEFDQWVKNGRRAA
jgi:hypothetical protein